MIVLGLLLILAAVAAAVFAVTAPSGAEQTIEVSALGFKLLASPLAMFIAGALSVILVGIGFALINRGARRKASSRKELRELRKGQADAAAHPSAEAGQHSSRHRFQKDTTVGGADTNTGTSGDTSTRTPTSGDTGTDSST
jgi:hypothetical protein